MLSLLRNPGRALGLTTPASSWRKTQSQQFNNVQGYKPKFQQLGNLAQAQQNQFQPQANAQAQDLVDYYKTDPYAQGRNSLLFKQATAGLEDGFNRQNAALMQRGAASGIDPTAAIQNNQFKRLATLGGINSNLALQNLQDQERRKQAAFGVSNGMAQQGMNDYRSALGSQMGIDQSLYGMAGDQAQQEEARAAQSKAALGGLLGQGASLFGHLSGMGALGSLGSISGLFGKKKKSSGGGGAVNLGYGANSVQGPDGTYY